LFRRRIPAAVVQPSDLLDGASSENFLFPGSKAIREPLGDVLPSLSNGIHYIVAVAFLEYVVILILYVPHALESRAESPLTP
jgi:hypothetical protein